MTAYYNEHDPFAAQWLRELIDAGHMAPGVVDERSIEDVKPSDLTGYTQCHCFAGIGVWSYALRRAGWPDNRPVWTGSCPCQPFSAAGKGDGFADERHLWPAWFHLIQYGKRPDISILGEQVASDDGLAWLDLVQTDLEGAGYACWPVDLCAAGVGAPHIRQRLFFVGERTGDSGGEGLAQRISDGRIQRKEGCAQSREAVELRGYSGGLGNPSREGPSEQRGKRNESAGPTEASSTGGLADAEGSGFEALTGERGQQRPPGPSAAYGGEDRRQQPGPTNGLWRDADWLFCRDGKWRPVEPSTFPLAHGAPARVGRLRGYGNAINAEAATAFIKAYLETERFK